MRSRIPQARQLLPCPDEALLDGVVGAVEVPQDAMGQRVQAIERDRGHRLERVMVSALRLLHEIFDACAAASSWRLGTAALHKV